MKALSERLAQAYATCCLCVSQCCLPLTTLLDEKASSQHNEKSFVVIHDEPSLIAPPSVTPAGPIRGQNDTSKREWAHRTRKRHGSGQSSFSMKKRLLPGKTSSSSFSSSSRRPQISAPSNFRHVHSESFHFPDSGINTAHAHDDLDLILNPRRPASFHPLELSIYDQGRKLSPMLPPFDEASRRPVTPPARVPASRSSPRSDNSQTMSRTRSYSSMSFHVPRRPVPGGSAFESPRSDASTTTPRRPPPVRVKTNTSPEQHSPMMEDLVERVANAMEERDRLQGQIDHVIERQSIYTNSRPSTPHAHSQVDMEQPMPEIPALPPNAPSFKERLVSDRAPSSVQYRPPPVSRTLYQANSSRKVEGRAPPPPLPLKLRPPLRKKKSFSRVSRVSTWLGFPGAGEHHNRDISLDSITNMPRPTRDADGFYQIAGAEVSGGARSSFDSVSCVSDWSASAGEQTVPTSWSPSSDMTAIKALADPFGPTLGGLAPPRPDSMANMAQPRRTVGVTV